MSSSILRSVPIAAASGSRIDWTPYLAGCGIGLLSVLVFVVVNKPLGITTEFSSLGALIMAPIMGETFVAQNSYWKATPFSWSYGTYFLIGVVLGGFLSAAAARRLRFEAVPKVWADRFGPSVAWRFLWAFIGGTIIMFGARLAGGCTSGHAISGGLQLALSSWVFIVVMFLSALITARVLYGPGGLRVGD